MRRSKSIEEMWTANPEKLSQRDYDIARKNCAAYVEEEYNTLPARRHVEVGYRGCPFKSLTQCNFELVNNKFYLSLIERAVETGALEEFPFEKGLVDKQGFLQVTIQPELIEGQIVPPDMIPGTTTSIR